MVITPLLRHAEFPRPPTVDDAWQLVQLMTNILETAGSAPAAAL
jgi:hypothetical protein